MGSPGTQHTREDKRALQGLHHPVNCAGLSDYLTNPAQRPSLFTHRFDFEIPNVLALAPWAALAEAVAVQLRQL